MTAMARIVTVDGLPPVVAVSAEVVEQVDRLLARYAALPEYTPETLGESDALVREIALLLRGLEAERKRLVAPALALQRAVNAAAESEAGRLDAAKRTIEAGHARVRREVEAAQREAEAARRRAEAEAAAAIRARQEAEARARADQAERERALAACATDTHSPEDKAALAELEAQAEARAQQEAQRVAAADLAARSAAAEAYMASMEAQPAALPKTSVVVRKVLRLRVTDATLVPDVVHGVSIKRIDERALEKLLRAGVTVPGAELVEVEETGTRA